MNKYKKLALNTVVFAIGSFGAKILSLLLNNLYTKNMNPSDFYDKNLLETTAWFLLPVFTFSMTESIIRFGLDKNYSKKSVFSTGVAITLGGLFIMLLLFPIIMSIPFLQTIKEYTLYLVLYIFSSAFRSLCSQFVRAREKLKLFSFDGILTTFLLFAFNVIFLSVLNLGVKGFLIASVLSDISSAVFLFFAAGLKGFTDIKAINKKLAGKMLKFALPLIPTIVMWTVIVYSDQIFIGNMTSDHVVLGKEKAGLYGVSTKIPNLISMASTIFFQAWNLSAITEVESNERNLFYGKVYKAYESMMFMCSAGLILLAKPVSSILINYSVFPEYRTAYIYTPLLIAAAIFNCLNDFLFSIYTATKHTKNAFFTGLAACLTNLILNYELIPLFGIQGAALATLLSHLVCYSIRIIDARKYVPFKVDFTHTIINTLIIMFMCGGTLFFMKYRIILNIILFSLVFINNSKSVLKTVDTIIKRK